MAGTVPYPPVVLGVGGTGLFGDIMGVALGPDVDGVDVAFTPAGRENRTLMGDGIVFLRPLRPDIVWRLLPPIAGERDDDMG